MKVPENLLYVPSHEWLRQEGEVATVGITDHAQAELTDIVYVELPKIGDKVVAGQAVAVVESVKAASDIYTPISGTIASVNETLSSDPGLVNRDPFGEGWIYTIKIEAGEELEKLLEPAQYAEQLKATGQYEV